MHISWGAFMSQSACLVLNGSFVLHSCAVLCSWVRIVQSHSKIQSIEFSPYPVIQPALCKVYCPLTKGHQWTTGDSNILTPAQLGESTPSKGELVGPRVPKASKPDYSIPSQCQTNVYNRAPPKKDKTRTSLVEN